jgi:hypothetical protein
MSVTPRKSSRRSDCTDITGDCLFAAGSFHSIHGSVKQSSKAVSAPTGTLFLFVSKHPFTRNLLTYFNRKIHRQEPCSVMPPPSNGPYTKLSAKATFTMDTYASSFRLGTNSMKSNCTSAKTPQPPMPWHHRNMMSWVRD